MKKPSFPAGEGDEGRPALETPSRKDSTPILSMAGQSPGPHGPGLDERGKAGLLTSGSSYSPRLAALSRSGTHEAFVTRYSGATAQDSHLFPYSPRVSGALFCRCPASRRDAIKEQGSVITPPGPG